MQSKGKETLVDLYVLVFRGYRWQIFGIAFGAGLLLLITLIFVPNRYTATAVISPSPEDISKDTSLGGFAVFGGLFGGTERIEDLEAVFNSGDLTARVFKKYFLWPVVFPRDFDPKTGKLKVSLLDRIWGEENYKDPTDWDAIRAAEDYLTVSVNRKFGHLTISFESFSPEWSAKITSFYLEEAKNRLQEEALARAMKNKKFIEEQISKTLDALTRDRLFNIYGKEVEKEMLARNREQFAFKIIDRPKVPDRKSGPRRLILSAFMMVIALMVSTIGYCFRESTRIGNKT